MKETGSLTREVTKNLEFYCSDTAFDEAHRLEQELEKATLKRVREAARMETLRRKHIILIDTPDCPKSDRQARQRPRAVGSIGFSIRASGKWCRVLRVTSKGSLFD